MERRIFLKLGTGAALGGALAACGGGGGGGYDPGPAPEPVRTRVAIGWNNAALAAVGATRAGPPIAARALAIVHTAMYDAWAAYDKVALGTGGAALRRPLDEQTPANQVRAFSYAAYVALLDQFPGQKAAFDAQMQALAYNPARAVPGANSPEGIGTQAARAVLARAHEDGSNQLGTLSASGVAFADYTGYTPRNAPMAVAEALVRSATPSPGQWQPLAYTNGAGAAFTQAYMVPFWGRVKPFALSDGAQFRPTPPAAFGSGAFVEQAKDLVAVQGALTETQKAMVDFWAGGASGALPSTYWSQFAQFVSARDSQGEDADVKMLFALSNAVFDAGIAAWDAKLAYDSARPITAIRYLMCDQTILGYGLEGPAGGLRQIQGQTWTPFQQPIAPTPPFPDHVSGHSTYSAASAEVLRRFTGSDTFNHSVTVTSRSMLIDRSLPTADIRLAWNTFTYAACEAGSSRVYGGIHFYGADIAGRALGEKVGAAVFEKAQRMWQGIA